VYGVTSTDYRFSIETWRKRRFDRRVNDNNQITQVKHSLSNLILVSVILLLPYPKRMHGSARCHTFPFASLY
jgi:hypothetical protein